MACCEKYLKLGCFGSCDVIKSEILVADVTGKHILSLIGPDYNNNFEIGGIIGQQFEIDLSKVNEASCIRFQIIKPNGDPLIVNEGGDNYTCFSINTSIINLA